MDAAAKRRKEIDAKKAKLAELKRQRAERQSIAFQAQIDLVTHPVPQKHDRQAVDDLVDSLVGQLPRPSTEARRSKPADPVDREILTHEEDRHVVDDDLVLAQVAQSRKSEQNELKSAYHEGMPVNGLLRTDLDQVNAVTGVPAVNGPRIKEVISYTKATQTQVESDPTYADLQAEESATGELELRDELTRQLRKEIENELQLERESLEKAKAETAAQIEASHASAAEKLRQAEAKLSEAIAATSLPDYTSDAEARPDRSEQEMLVQAQQFYNERTKNRMITSVDWSPKFPELVLASYSKDIKVTNRMHGVVLVWNLKAPDDPQFSLSCQGEVLQAIFSPYHANIIIGGTYSGQVLIWDVKVKDRPILTTPLTSKGHTYPITGLHIIGTKQSHSIVSTSSDGTVCTWSTDLLAQPQDSFQLSLQPPSKVEEVNPTAVSHSAADTSVFLIGTEDGNMYNVNRQDRAGAKAGIDPTIIYRGHAAMLTSIEHHRCKGQHDHGDLVLTSSLDWTVKLWRVQNQSHSAPIAIGARTIQSLTEFELDDMVYDVRWSPARPSVFACVDGAGKVNIFDLCKNIEVSIANASPTTAEDTFNVGMPIQPALNKLGWNPDGRQFAVGGVDGRLSVFDVPTSVSGKDGLTTEQWQKFSSRLKMMASRRG